MSTSHNWAQIARAKLARLGFVVGVLMLVALVNLYIVLASLLRTIGIVIYYGWVVPVEFVALYVGKFFYFTGKAGWRFVQPVAAALWRPLARPTFVVGVLALVALVNAYIYVMDVVKAVGSTYSYVFGPLHSWDVPEVPTMKFVVRGAISFGAIGAVLIGLPALVLSWMGIQITTITAITLLLLTWALSGHLPGRRRFYASDGTWTVWFRPFVALRRLLSMFVSLWLVTLAIMVLWPYYQLDPTLGAMETIQLVVTELNQTSTMWLQLAGLIAMFRLLGWMFSYYRGLQPPPAILRRLSHS